LALVLPEMFVAVVWLRTSLTCAQAGREGLRKGRKLFHKYFPREILKKTIFTLEQTNLFIHCFFI